MDAATNLYLEVFINDVSTDLVAAFRRLADGSFEIAPEELREVGLLPDEAALTRDGAVALDRLPGVGFAYDESAQTMRFVAEDDARAARRIMVSGSAPRDGGPPPRADWGAVVNYTLFASAGGERPDDVDQFEGVSGALEARAFGPLGTLHASALAASTPDEPHGLTRLDTTWSRSDSERLLTYRAGDLIAGGLAWTRPVRLGGVQIERNFGLRPDLVTLPLPEFADSAAVPSTLDIYSAGGLAYSGSLPAGPFVAGNLPVVTGAGRARFVLTDALGRQTVSERSYYIAPGMLRAGLFDFSIEAGIPRRSYGTQSFDYAGGWAAAASARYGLRGGFTLEAHAEAGQGLLNGGAGGVFPLGGIGAGSVAIAGSTSDEGSGFQASASFEIGIGNISVFGRAQRTFGEYRDIAAVSGEGDPFDRLPAEALEQISAAFPLVFDAGTLSLGATRVEHADGEESLIGTLSYSRPLPRSATLYASAYAELEEDADVGGYLGFSMPLGGLVSATAGVDAGPNGAFAVADVARAETTEPGSIGWRVRSGYGDEAEHAAGLSYRTGYGRIEAGAAHSGAGTRATAQLDGAVVVAGGGVFLTDRIEDAFAVVDVGAPGVGVLYENRPVGRTGRSGRLVVPGLRSYEANKIAIDPENLPVDAIVPSTEEVVVPADRSGIRVAFGVSTDTPAALVGFRGADGAPIEAGSTGELGGGGAPFFVGYDGEAYVTGLGRRNLATITRADGSVCAAEFGFEPREGAQVRIPDVACVAR